MGRHRLTLPEHAELILILAQHESLRLRMLDLLRNTPVSGKPLRAWQAMEKASAKMQSALENDLYENHPDEAAAAGFPHYNLAPLKGAAARFVAAHRAPSPDGVDQEAQNELT